MHKHSGLKNRPRHRRLKFNNAFCSLQKGFFKSKEYIACKILTRNSEGKLDGRNQKNTDCNKGLVSAWCDNGILLLLVFVLLTSCAPFSPLQTTVPNRAESRAFDMKAPVVRTAVEKVLTQRKFTVKYEQSNGQHLQTEWLHDGGYRNMVKTQVKALSKDRTELTVEFIFEKKTLWKDSWQPVAEIGKDAYDDFMNDVLLESYRILYDGG